MARTYTTASGTYSEEDLAVVIWSNPKISKRPQSRRLETMTSPRSSYPMAFPIAHLTSHYAWKKFKVVNTPDDIDSLIGATSRQAPILVPLPLAKSYLGWDEFYIPTEYTNIGD
jgi:hypothetical protein